MASPQDPTPVPGGSALNFAGSTFSPPNTIKPPPVAPGAFLPGAVNYADAVGGPTDQDYYKVGNTGPFYNPQYGGGYGGANQVAQELENQAQTFGSQKVPSLSGLSSSQELAVDSANNVSRRAQVMDAVSQLGTAARGDGPSAATIGMGSSEAGNLASAYAAGRTGGALGLQAAQAGNAGANINAVGQGANARGAEVSAAQNAYAGSAGNLRAADLTNEGNTQNFEFNNALVQQQAQNQNTQESLQSESMANQVLLDQLQASSSFGNTLSGNTAQLGAQQIGINAAQQSALIGGLTGAAGGAFGAVAGYAGGSGVASDVRLKRDINFADAVTRRA